MSVPLPSKLILAPSTDLLSSLAVIPLLCSFDSIVLMFSKVPKLLSIMMLVFEFVSAALMTFRSVQALKTDKTWKNYKRTFSYLLFEQGGSLRFSSTLTFLLNKSDSIQESCTSGTAKVLFPVRSPFLTFICSIVSILTAGAVVLNFVGLRVLHLPLPS